MWPHARVQRPNLRGLRVLWSKLKLSESNYESNKRANVRHLEYLAARRRALFERITSIPLKFSARRFSRALLRAVDREPTSPRRAASARASGERRSAHLTAPACSAAEFTFSSTS